MVLTMASWYLFSIAALLLLGSQRFLYKVAAERGCNSVLTTTIFMATVTLLSTVTYASDATPINNPGSLLLWSLVNSTTFAAATIFNIEALKRLPASVTFPLTRLTMVLVILFSLSYFGDRLHTVQWLGMLSAFSVVGVLLSELRRKQMSSQQLSGLWFVGANISCAALSSISCKFAAMQTDKAAFMALTYFLATIFSLLINLRWKKPAGTGKNKGALSLGLAMGILNFVGFYALLSAMEKGPLSAVVLITGMQFIIAIMLSVILYREQLSRPRVAAIILALVAVVLMKQ